MSRNSKCSDRQSVPNGCPILVDDNQRCGETQTLEIIKEFKQLYEKKMKQIDAEAGGDCLPALQAKLQLQQEWIRDLTEQNEMLVRAVEELEVEATDRVAMLEEKLRNSAQYGAQVMQKYRDFSFSINLDETFQKLVYLQSDVRNLLKFIRRVRDEGKWSIDGLHFYDIACQDLFGCSPCCLPVIGDQKVQKKMKMLQTLEEKEKRLKELEEKISQMPNEVDLAELSSKLKEKDEELTAMKRSMLDMRNALTIEVAEKHDVILNLRRDVQQLEEQYRQSNKQTQFKDDIIKEMRREIKLLKGQEYEEKSRLLHIKNAKLQSEVNLVRSELNDNEQKILNLSADMKHNMFATWLKLKSCENIDSLNREVVEIKKAIENDCLLFFTLGKEIDMLLQDSHEKGKRLVYQKELIEFLSGTVIFFYYKLIEIRAVSSKCKHTENGGESDELRKRIKELEEECSALRHGVSEAKQELEALDGRANEYLAERDEYIQKHKESTQLIEEMTLKFEIERGQFEKRRRESESMIECLKQQYVELERGQRNRCVTFEDLQGHRSMQETVDAMQNNFENNEAPNKNLEELQEILQQRGLEDSDSRPTSSKHSKKFPTSESSSMATWPTPDSGPEQLEETIHQLACTVTKMMEGKKDTNLHGKIAELREALAKIQREREIERATRNQEVVNLKQTILELEKALQNAQIRAESLQKAVDLYKNSMNVLEASEERARIEISQQRQTILNLQEALVVSKHRLDEVQQKASSEVSFGWASRWLGSSMAASKPANNNNKSVHDV